MRNKVDGRVIALVCAVALLAMLVPAQRASAGWLCAVLGICWHYWEGGNPHPPGSPGPVVSVADLEAEGTALSIWDLMRVAVLAENGQYDEAAREVESLATDPVATMVAARLRLLAAGVSPEETNQQVDRLVQVAGRMRNDNVAASAALTAALKAEQVRNTGVAVTALEFAEARLERVDVSALPAEQQVTTGGLLTEVMRGWVRVGPRALEQPGAVERKIADVRQKADDALAAAACLPTSDPRVCRCAEERKKDLLKVELAVSEGEHGWVGRPGRPAVEVRAELGGLTVHP